MENSEWSYFVCGGMTALMWGCFCGILGQKEGDENGFFWNCSDRGYYWSRCISGSNDISEQQTRRKNEITGIRTSGQDRKTAARSWDLWRVHSCGGGLCSGCQHRRSSRIWKTFCAGNVLCRRRCSARYDETGKDQSVLRWTDTACWTFESDHR